jgi:putative flippase GtrA
VKKEKSLKTLDRILMFVRAQISAFTGGVTDYLVMILITELFHVHYTISIAIGGVVGAIVNFSINKGWSFYSTEMPYKNALLKQLFRFSLVVLNSIILKSSGTFVISSTWLLDYKFSRLIADLIVSVVFNYTLQRFWVFQRKKTPG